MKTYTATPDDITHDWHLVDAAGVPLGLAASQPAGLVQLEWCAGYSGPARDCLHALKYDGEQRLTEESADLQAVLSLQVTAESDVDDLFL